MLILTNQYLPVSWAAGIIQDNLKASGDEHLHHIAKPVLANTHCLLKNSKKTKPPKHVNNRVFLWEKRVWFKEATTHAQALCHSRSIDPLFLLYMMAWTQNTT